MKSLLKRFAANNLSSPIIYKLCWIEICQLIVKSPNMVTKTHY